MSGDAHLPDTTENRAAAAIHRAMGRACVIDRAVTENAGPVDALAGRRVLSDDTRDTIALRITLATRGFEFIARNDDRPRGELFVDDRGRVAWLEAIDGLSSSRLIVLGEIGTMP